MGEMFTPKKHFLDQNFFCAKRHFLRQITFCCTKIVFTTVTFFQYDFFESDQTFGPTNKTKKLTHIFKKSVA